MIQGHGDDLYAYPRGIHLNYSSNIISPAAAEWLPAALLEGHEGLRRHLAAAWQHIGHYPGPEPQRAEEALAQWLHISPDEVLLTNGATEAIYMVAQRAGAKASFIAEPTFSEYHDACLRYGGQPECYTPSSQLGHSLLWLCNPNNPTGEVTPKGKLEALIEHHPTTLFVIDQSYETFTTEALFTAREACDRHNVVVLHSMTKQFGVPGLRLGFVTAHRHLIRQLRQLRWPWAVSTLSAEAVCHLCNHADDYALPLTKILKERARVAKALTDTGAIDVHPSQTHYMLCRLHKGCAADLKQWLATQHGILIRDASNFRGLTPAHFRIAVQGRKADDTLIQAIEVFLKRNDK